MPAYLISEIEITDPVRYEDYRKMVPATLAAYGGRFVIRGGASQTLEGDWHPKRLITIEFESVARALEWYHSAEYRPARELRQATSNSRVILVEGL